MFLSSGAISQQVAAAAPGAPVAADVDMVFVVPPGGGIDVTAPVLSSASAVANGAEAFTGSVSTDEGAGRLYWVVTTSATTPGAAQIRNGQDHTGAAAVASGAQDVVATGAQDVAGSGLTAETAYHVHFHQLDAAASPNASAVASASFTTAAISSTPVIESRSQQVFDADAVSHTPTMPTGITAGDIIVAVIGASTNPTISITGYSSFTQEDQFGNAASRAFHRVADGTSGDDITITLSAAEAAASAIFRISGASTVEAQSTSGTGTDPDPPSISPAAGAGDYLIIAAAVGDSSDGFTGGPAGYSNYVGTDGLSTDAVSIGTADKEVTGSSEDPGTFTMGGSEQWSAWTIAVS